VLKSDGSFFQFFPVDFELFQLHLFLTI